MIEFAIDLSLRGMNSTLNMSASIEIPRSELCNNITNEDEEYGEDDDSYYYYYNYDGPCENETNCTGSNGYYYYYYYDLTEIFGNCSKVFSIDEGWLILLILTAILLCSFFN